MTYRGKCITFFHC